MRMRGRYSACMYVQLLTIVHVLISLIGIAAGFVALSAFTRGERRNGATTIFLVTTIATSVTGFFFPFKGVTPGHIFGVLSLIALPLAWHGWYGARLRGGWRKTFLITATFAQYLNVFVAVVQAFQKIPFLHELAPTQAEPPFAVAQLLVLIACVWLGYQSVKKFHPAVA